MLSETRVSGVLSRIPIVRSDGSRSDARSNREELIDAVGRLLAEASGFTLNRARRSLRRLACNDLPEFLDPAGCNRCVRLSIPGGLRGRGSGLVDRDESRPSRRAVSSVGSPGRRATPGPRPRSFRRRISDSSETRQSHHREDPPTRANEPRGHDGVGSAARERSRLRAVFLWNLLLDPRELVDLAEHLDTSIPRAAELLTTDFLTILRSRS